MRHPVVGRKKVGSKVVGPFPFQKAIIDDFKLLADFCSLLACLKEYNYEIYICLLFSMLLTYEAVLKINTPLIFHCQSTFVEVFLGCTKLRAASYARNFNCLPLKFIAVMRQMISRHQIVKHL